ncbi:MAG TPA: HNH endonuclease [Bellilinea sp.]|nr:HNH endonuclease [Bellilinea sp.]
MTERKSISKRVRFEIFKRDSFTCQYCGKAAPNVLLEIDHIQPVSKGGDNEIGNLITSCKDCNAGKSDRELSDDTAVKKQKAQLDDLQERRNQLEMMLDWQRSLASLEDEQIDAACELFADLVPGYSVNDSGRKTIKKLIKAHEIGEVLECIRISASQYIETDEGGKIVSSSVQKTFDYIGKIANSRRRIAKKPYLRDLYYIRGIVRKRMYCNDWEALSLLEKAYLNGVETDELKDIAITARNWTDWRLTMEELAGDD